VRYPKGHRVETRARVLDAAGRLFKKHGFAGTGVDAVMREAALTAGGFYKHFSSKDDLFARTVERLLRDQVEHWLGGDAEGAAWVDGFLDRYLSTQHRDVAEHGCAMPSLAPEIARAGAPARRALERHVRTFLDHLTAQLRGTRRADRAIAMLALSVGGVVLARAVADRAFSDLILSACRRAATHLSRPGVT
jgi:TetR/AcrR family transcriptional repressor of nem operon